MPEPFLSPRTAQKLSEDHPVGSRHAAILEIALDMVGNGWSESAIFAKIRNAFPAEKTDKEITDAIRGAIAKNPTPSTPGASGAAVPFPRTEAPKLAVATKTPGDMAAWWLGGFETTQERSTAASPIQIPPGEQLTSALLFTRLYGEAERINIVTKHTINEKGKANPQGSGKSMLRDEWVAYFGEKGVPRSSAGAWMRPNPTTETGSGKEGAVTDADITAFRFLLIESDVLPLETQLALYAKWKLPIAAVIHSGGDSAHAWVRVDAETKEAYNAVAKRLSDTLHPFGFDRANKNPSRLSRLPGAKREIGASGDGMQRLLWLNPDTAAITEDALAAFETQLQSPLIDDMPFKGVFRQAIARYKELRENRGRKGVPTGIKQFDDLTGGLKGGQMIVIAAKTGGGKTTLATNIANVAASHNGIGVALFSLEMDRDEICDLFVAMNCSVNRNAFNTGIFNEGEFDSIVRSAERMAKLPLFIFDDPMMSTPQIRQRTLQLHAEKKIGLIIVDYAQFVSCDAFKDNREQQVARISRDLRALAKETKLPLILLSQLNDEGKIRESRVIAHDAHVVMLAEEREDGDLQIKVVKGRSIPRGEYTMLFDKMHSRLTNP